MLLQTGAAFGCTGDCLDLCKACVGGPGAGQVAIGILTPVGMRHPLHTPACGPVLRPYLDRFCSVLGTSSSLLGAFNGHLLLLVHGSHRDRSQTVCSQVCGLQALCTTCQSG